MVTIFEKIMLHQDIPDQPEGISFIIALMCVASPPLVINENELRWQFDFFDLIMKATSEKESFEKMEYLEALRMEIEYQFSKVGFPDGHFVKKDGKTVWKRKLVNVTSPIEINS